MNILYIDHGSVTSDSHMYRYYGDLFRELKELADVYVFEGFASNIDVLLSHVPINIDCIIFGLGYFSQNNPRVYQKISGLSELDIPVVAMLHKPQTMLSEKLQFCKINKVDLLLDSQSTYKRHGEIVETKSIRSWFTATPKLYYPREIEKKYDIGFSGALHGDGKIFGPTKDLRVRIQDILLETDYKVFWNSSNTLDYRISSFEEYAKKINESKIWLATTGPTEDVSPRYFEVALSKTLLFCNDMPEQYGGVFQDGINCVTFRNDLSDFNEKFIYYLQNDDERTAIIEKAYDIVKNSFTWKHMALNLLKEVEEVRSVKVQSMAPGQVT